MNHNLTPKEIAILKSAADGLSYVQIANRCGVCRNTIKNHCSRIREKLGADNTTHAVAIALRRGIIE